MNQGYNPNQNNFNPNNYYNNQPMNPQFHNNGNNMPYNNYPNGAPTPYQQPVAPNYYQNPNQKINPNNQIPQGGQFPNNQNNQKPKKKKTGLIVLAIIGGIVFVAIAVLVLLLIIGSMNSNKLVCTSPEGSITIMYSKSGLTGYSADGIVYDINAQKELAKQLGVDEYIVEFNDWFTSNTTGTCKNNGKELEKSSETNDSGAYKKPSYETKTVGDDKKGYIDIPDNWGSFYDPDAVDTLQYSYGYTYIVSLSTLDGGYTAKDYATSYINKKQSDSNVTGVTGATVTIGKTKEYNAYQVYMYYPADNKYLITYWFEAEDGVVHYIAIEGPSSVSEYLAIAQSFRLQK